MLEPYSQSAILAYSTPTATSLNGSLLSFFEINGNPVLFSTISKDIFSIYFINPHFSFASFVEEILSLTANLESPLFLFTYDQLCFAKYKSSFNIDCASHFTSFHPKYIDSDRFTDLEDFFSFTLIECFTSFFNYAMYENFAKSKELFEIVNFVRSVMFSKVVLTIDSFATHKYLPRINKEVIPVISGESPCALPPTACLIDFETLGLDEYSDIILFTIYKNNSFFSYYLTDTSPEGQHNFREFIKFSLQHFDVVYVFHADFESKFFPDIQKFVDIRFKKYQYWASARRLVHLPFHHLEFDPGSGKNIPIWNKLFLLDNNELFMDLILKRTVTNILTKLAILASNIATIPFHDPIVANIRKFIPPLEFLNELNQQPSLLKKKICFFPNEYYNTYHEQYKEVSEMYVDNLFFIQDKKVEDE